MSTECLEKLIPHEIEKRLIIRVTPLGFKIYEFMNLQIFFPRLMLEIYPR